jgi:16S rRNA C967 or C1407 C5-methylase (RsmB/RsmF family)/NOL1/NOP2/fmu family ribosome biogenesis protein
MITTDNTPRLPDSFIKRITAQWGVDEAQRYIESLGEKPSLSIRLNPKKLQKKEYTDAVPWCSSGYYLPERPDFIFDPHHHGGAYYVQEASSMFLEKLLHKAELPANPLVLDLCASPGGKTTHLLALMPDTALIHANEAILSRVAALKENLIRWGYPNLLITRADPVQFEHLPDVYDLVVVDAPCSGEGLFRKTPAAVKEWSEDNLKLCEMRQRRILSSVIKTVRDEGWLIYSTCTFNPGENEEQIAFLKQNGFDYIPVLAPGEHPEITRVYHNGEETGYAFRPHQTRGEGFFAALLKKNGTVSQSAETQKGGRSFFEKKIPVPDAVQALMNRRDDFSGRIKKDTLFLLPKAWENTIEWISAQLPTVYAGVESALHKGNDWIPQHPLALSILLKTETGQIEVNKAEALQFLKKESLAGREISKGYYQVQFEGTRLGWVKAIPGRLNNLLPPEFRIRKNLNQE